MKIRNSTYQLTDEDRAVIHDAHEIGIGVLHEMFSEDEVEKIRIDFTQAHEDAGLGELVPAKRVSLRCVSLFQYPHLGPLYYHPRIMAIVSAILGEPNPWLYQYKTNRYTPVHEGVKKHTDGFGGLVPAHQTQAMAIFLDDISAESGALTYVPRTHLLYYTDREPPKDSAPSKEDLDNGEYIPLEVKPGSVLFRVPEMWHAVIPIHHLRRYVTAAYVRKSNTSETCQKKVAESVEQRKEIDTSRFPPEILRMWDYWD